MTPAQLEAGAHTLITRVTEARTADQARDVAGKYLPSVVRVAADILHIETDGHGVAWLRSAVVTEARA